MSSRSARKSFGQIEQCSGCHVAIISANPSLDATAIQLQQSGALILRVPSEALSKAFEVTSFVDAISWAVSELGVTTLMLIGHSQAAVVPSDDSSQSFNLQLKARLHNERIDASKIKLLDDFARCRIHSVMGELPATNQFTLEALLYLHESDSFLRFDTQSSEFHQLGETSVSAS